MQVNDQPPPAPNERPAVWGLVLEDMKARDRTGRERYGTPLQTHNGRDALVDAYQEALDLAVYLRQEIEEDWRGRALAAEEEVRALRATVAQLRDAHGPFAWSASALRLERERAALTRAEVAARLEVTRSTIANWESGRSEPSAGQAALLAALFRAPLHCLFRSEATC